MGKLTIQDAIKYPNAEMIRTTPAEITETYFNSEQFENILDAMMHVGSINSAHVFISDCKLILRPLSSLTEEEKEKVFEFFMNPHGIHSNQFGGWNNLNLIIVNCAVNKVKELIDYLRSINIDIDNFKEQGKAVYENE